MYADVLMCLTRDPLAGVVSPSLLGTSGTIPLSIVSTIPDIMRHYADCSERPVALLSWTEADISVATSRFALALRSHPGREGGLPGDQ
jgi:hypothetical protein